MCRHQAGSTPLIIPSLDALVVLGSLLLGHRLPPPAFNPDTGALQFQEFRAGARLYQLDSLLRTMDGSRLRCRAAKADRRVSECRATVTHPRLGGPVSLWVSAIDSVAGIITLSSPVASEQLDRWRQNIEARYGRVSPRAQGSQWMMQWVRRGRMLRLTWRVEHGGRVVSVSLVDGRVLDDWGKSRPQRKRIKKLPSDSSRT